MLRQAGTYIVAVKNLLAWGIPALCIGFLLTALPQYYALLQAQGLGFTWSLALLSVLPLLISYALLPAMWCSVLRSGDVALSYRQAFQIQYLAHLGKYIPGKIWAYATQSYLAAQAQVSLTATLVSSALLMGFSSLGSLWIFALSLGAWEMGPIGWRVGILLVVCAMLAVVLRTHVLERLMQYVLTRVYQPSERFLWHTLAYPTLCVQFCLHWLFFHFGLYLFLSSMYPLSFREGILITGTFAIAWVLGYYTFLAPGGLGVQEGIHVYLLSWFLPVPLAVVIAFFLRLWMICGDVLIFGLAVAWQAADKRVCRLSKVL